MAIPGPSTPPPAVVAVSSDGVVSLALDASGAAVAITVDFTKLSPAPAVAEVTVTRGDGTVVRGLDAQPAPGGVTFGVDAEMPLGAVVSYTASGGASGPVSAPAQIETPPPSSTWLKSLTSSALSVSVIAEKLPDWTRGVNQSVVWALQNPSPAVASDVRRLGTGTLSVLTSSPADQAALDALLASPGPYLLQCSAAAAEPDRYVAVGPVTVSRPSQLAGDPWRSTRMPLTETARPGTGGSYVSAAGETIADTPSGPISGAPAGRIVDPE